jgi:superfamily II DNA/RNA helicase
VPMSPDDYVHRIGRTGRAGQSGRAWMFTTPMDEKFLVSVEKTIKKSIPVVELNLSKPSSSPREEKAFEKPVIPRVEVAKADMPKRERFQPDNQRPKSPSSRETKDEVVVDGPGFGDDIPSFLR